jgi:integrase/recombinase XerC
MIKILSNSEFTKLEEAFPTFTLAESAAISLMLYCGLRVGEVARLILKDLEDFTTQRPMVHIRASISKTGMGRYVPIPQKARKILHDYIYLYTDKPPNFQPGSFLFPGTAGRPHKSIHGLEQLVNRCCRRCIGRHITPHFLRHTYATRLLRFSNIREVQLCLGHIKLTSTQVYTHPTMDDLSTSVDKAFR